MTSPRTFLRFAAAFLFVVSVAPKLTNASMVTYEFSATVSSEFRQGTPASESDRLFADGDPILGSLVYDNDAAILSSGVGEGTVYSGITDFSGSVNGLNFFDPSGNVVVANDTFDGQDGFVLTAQPRDPPNVPISGITIENNGDVFNLVNVSILWLEGSNPDFLSDQALPTSLPPAGGIIGTLRLQFLQADDAAVEHEVFAEPVLIQVVPIPAAVWLFGSALGLLGWMKRRRI